MPAEQASTVQIEYPTSFVVDSTVIIQPTPLGDAKQVFDPQCIHRACFSVFSTGPLCSRGTGSVCFVEFNSRQLPTTAPLDAPLCCVFFAEVLSSLLDWPSFVNSTKLWASGKPLALKFVH